jgi:hypothetical protein
MSSKMEILSITFNQPSRVVVSINEDDIYKDVRLNKTPRDKSEKF